MQLAELKKKHPEIRADFTIDQHWERYTATEHGMWRTLFERQSQILRGRACDEFLAGLRSLHLVPDQIPDFERASDQLQKLTGWRTVAVPSLVPDEIFQVSIQQLEAWAIDHFGADRMDVPHIRTHQFVVHKTRI